MAIQNDNRVLVRRGARMLTSEEVNTIAAGIHVPTNSFCTFDVRSGSPVPEDTESC